jgi:hypothetical protein
MSARYSSAQERSFPHWPPRPTIQIWAEHETETPRLQSVAALVNHSVQRNTYCLLIEPVRVLGPMP